MGSRIVEMGFLPLLAIASTAMAHARVATQAARAGGTPRLFRAAGKRLSRLTTLVDTAERGGLLAPDTVITLQSLSTIAYDAFALWHPTNP